jgi:hypothetical protein
MPIVDPLDGKSVSFGLGPLIHLRVRKSMPAENTVTVNKGNILQIKKANIVFSAFGLRRWGTVLVAPLQRNRQISK